jgi:hypothetical protein
MDKSAAKNGKIRIAYPGWEDANVQGPGVEVLLAQQVA